MTEKFETLIGKKISLILDGKEINSFKITKMHQPQGIMEDRGFMIPCDTDWADTTAFNPPGMAIDEKTLEELIKIKQCSHPLMSGFTWLITD